MAKDTVDDSKFGFIWLLNSLSFTLSSFLREIFRITFFFVEWWEWNSWKNTKNSLKRHQWIRGWLLCVCVCVRFTLLLNNVSMTPSQQVFHPACFFGIRSGMFSAIRGYPHLLCPFWGVCECVCLRVIWGDTVGKKKNYSTKQLFLYSLSYALDIYAHTYAYLTQISLVMYPDKIIQKLP